MQQIVKYAVLVAIFLAGCAGPPQRHAIKSVAYGPSNAGLIVGRISSSSWFGTGVTFKSVATGAKFTYTGATEFSMWLPEGEYEVSGIGSPRGSLGPFHKPLGFHVVKSYIAYVGTLSYGCSRRSQVMEWYGIQNCGFLALADNCTVAAAQVPMCVIDEQEQTVGAFITQWPSLGAMPITSALMK